MCLYSPARSVFLEISKHVCERRPCPNATVGVVTASLKRADTPLSSGLSRYLVTRAEGLACRVKERR